MVDGRKGGIIAGKMQPRSQERMGSRGPVEGLDDKQGGGGNKSRGRKGLSKVSKIQTNCFTFGAKEGSEVLGRGGRGHALAGNRR